MILRGPSVLLVVALWMVPASFSRKDELARVFVYSKASEEYTARRSSPDGLVPESYHMMQGRFFGGDTADTSLSETDFQALADALKMELVTQQYYPARNFKDGDLLIVVHWGTTGSPENLEEDFGEDVGIEQSLDESDALAPRSVDEKILGFDAVFEKGGLSLKQEKILLSQYHTERYFFILTAYDWQKKIETGETELLWTTRFSLDSIGTNFVDSFPALFRGARDYYGVNLDGMADQKTNFGQGEVSMGELEVIESAEEAKDIK